MEMGLDMGGLYFLDVCEPPDSAAVRLFLSWLDGEKREKLEQQTARGSYLSLCADALARHIACRELALPPEALRFSADANGKPYLCGYESFQYSLSHTQGGVIAAVSDKAVGVDVEKLRATNLKLAARFFSAGENAYISDAPEEASRRFFEVWTRKEAYLKRSGIGIRVRLDSFDTVKGDAAADIETILYGGYVLSWCCERRLEPHITALTPPDLL